MNYGSRVEIIFFLTSFLLRKDVYNNENKKKNLIKMKKLNMKKTNKCFCLILLFLSIYFIE